MLPKLLDVAEGISYLHTCYMMHRDLKGVSFRSPANAIEETTDVFQAQYFHRHTRVSDFGPASIAHGKNSRGIKSKKGHTVRCSAPEVLF